ncbi:MAG: hypothetical protein JW996_04830 [Candidatus Cloacimonetes bacterium]|nr:hypothetical protein [Candidatus Cloacimonadota bacterium]
MSVFERIDINTKRKIPLQIQIILLIALLFGFYLRGCWKKNQESIVTITETEIVTYTPGNIDVKFRIINPNPVTLKKPVMIKVYAKDGFQVASKLSMVEITGKSDRKYLKVLTKFDRPLNDDLELDYATVEIYNP